MQARAELIINKWALAAQEGAHELLTWAQHKPRLRLWVFGGAALLMGIGMVAFITVGVAPLFAPSAQAQALASLPTSQTPLYPAVAGAVSMTDMASSTVLEIVEQLRETSRFELLLYNAGMLDELRGPGPYTLLAPADQYFDYLPKRTIVSLSYVEEKKLAAHHVIKRALLLDTQKLNGTIFTAAGDTVSWQVNDDTSVSVGGGFVLRGYQGSNGVVYVISKVLL